MDPEMIVKMAILIIVSLLRLTVALPLFFTARRNSLVNLYWLSAQFLALVVAIPFADAGTMGNRYIFWTFISFSEIALIMFIHTTFRQGKYSPMPIFMALAVIGLFGGLYGTITDNFELSAWMVYTNVVIIWGWHIRESLSSYLNIANDKSAEDWVKSRYLLMITYSIVDFIGAVLGTLLTTGLWDSNVGSIIVVGINFTSATLQILTWVMPEWFRRFLNRNQQARVQANLESRVKTIMDVIGISMTDGTNATKLISFYAIRTTVGKKLQVEDSFIINNHIDKMGYQDWQRLFDDQELRRLLTNSGASVDADKAIRNAREVLVKQQSLFTLTAE